MRVDLGTVKLNAIVDGDGPLVVLLHGFPESSWAWRHQVPALARRFRVVAPDLRGYGASDKPAGVNAYAMPHLVDDVERLIRRFGAQRAHVVGHDWGGAIAWAFGALRPALVERLVVMNAPHPTHFARRVFRNPRQLLRSWYMLWFQVPRLPEALALRDPARTIARVFRGAAVDRRNFTRESLAPFVEALTRPGALTAALNYYRAAWRDLAAGRLAPLPRIEAPTMLVWARNDVALGNELTVGLAPYVRDLRIEYIPRCGHFVQQEQPGKVTALLDDFLR